MEITAKLLTELQRRLKIGNRRGVHLNAVPSNSRYKFDLNRLSFIDKNLPNNFIQHLLSEQPLKFRISWKNNVPDLNSLFEEDQTQLVKITKSFENLINQTDVIESEKGINTFGFGFPILIRRNQTDNKLTVAPILIWSLRIKQTKEFNTWEINRTEDDPIYLNEVLINHLQNDSNVQVEQIPSEMLDDGLINKDELIEICTNLIKAINTSVPNDVQEIFRKNLENISFIEDKAHYEKLTLNSTNAFIHFGGLFSIFEVQKQNIISDYNNLMELEGLSIDLQDLEGQFFQPITSIETDPSQQSILRALGTTRNILIQGPPGTGKSQTLTAILVQALENQKRTIVVCEKRTALEVLHNALIEKGLNYNCVLIKDIVKDRKTVVDSVRDRLENSTFRTYHYNCSKEDLDNLLAKTLKLTNSINSKHKKLDEKLYGNKSWTFIVGKLLAELDRKEDDNKLNLDKGQFNYESQELNRTLDLVRKGQLLYADFKLYEPTSFINSATLIGNNPYRIEQSINDSFEYYATKLNNIKELEQDYRKEYFNIRISELVAQMQMSIEIQNSIHEILEIHKNNPDFLNEKKTSGIIYKSLTFFSRSRKKNLMDQKLIRTDFKKLESQLLNSKVISEVIFSNSISSNIYQLTGLQKVLNDVNSSFTAKIDSEYSVLNLINLNSTAYTTGSLTSLKENFIDLSSKIASDNWTYLNIDFTNYTRFISDVENIIVRKQAYFSNEIDLFSLEFKWYQFYNELNETNKNLINELKSKINWEKAFLIHYFNSMLLNSASIDLPTNNDEYVELDDTLSKIEKEQFKFIREFWFSKQIYAKNEFEFRNDNLSIENLYNKRSSQRLKRLSLRQIIQYDANLFTTFFPIILTSPDVCCNLFKGMNGYFDIVMFDEASQLRLEDNLPAILKGKQIIIAGDEHQMPPSNYFNQVLDGTIEDEDDIDEEDKIVIDKDNLLLSCESLLDFGTELNFEKKYLDFHYRSRHPFLIDFSNYAFYNQRLKPIPNELDYVPIKFIQVNGTFSEYTNEAESEMVLSVIENNINRLPNGQYPTLGVATFNIAQRNLIKSKIQERLKFSKYAEFNAKIQELEENGMFIKNLENIQGDEKDIIILSTTYGTGKDGKFALRFGPINHSKGYKLLNVIITRAKYKIYVCSSIPEHVFMNYKEHLIVEGSNNKKAVLFAYLAYCKAVSENDNNLRLSVLNTLSENTSKTASFDSLIGGELESPFEEEVYQYLSDSFEPDNLIPQLKIAEYRIDIVYDSKKAGIPKIAIECDGAKYHSSNEAYLYDRHRQKILEGHGFIFHRIWSTNWWRNPKREAKILVDFIKNVEKENSYKLKESFNVSLAFTDEIVNIEKYVSPLDVIEIKNESEKIKKIDDNTSQPTNLLKDTVKLNSKVKVKYLNIDKDIKVQLVETTNNKKETSTAIQKIYFKSPLAISISGHSIGEIIKVGNLDNFVEILEVTN
jgi:very-short-patch-repair endonuclease